MVNKSDQDPFQLNRLVTVSADGFIRVTLSKLYLIQLEHLFSAIDESTEDAQFTGAVACGITGYTEWVSQSTPVISVGWDWEVQTSIGRANLSRLAEPRTNLMIVDKSFKDVGQEQSNQHIAKLIDRTEWQAATEVAIGFNHC